jgi:hypothetical protein
MSFSETVTYTHSGVQPKTRTPAGRTWLTTVILATWEADIKRITVQHQPRQIVRETSICKITKAKSTGGLTQAVECLLCKPKAPRSTKKQTKHTKPSPHHTGLHRTHTHTTLHRYTHCPAHVHTAFTMHTALGTRGYTHC